MSVAEIARTLALQQLDERRWHGRCPSCGYPTGFVVVGRENEQPLVYCKAGGCRQAKLVAVLRRRRVWPYRGFGPKQQESCGPDELKRHCAAKERERQRKIAVAADMWLEAHPASGTLVENYLRSRNVTLEVPPVIRLLGMHGAYGSHPTGARRPQMIARVEHLHSGPVAVHCTYLATDGSGKASLDPVRMSHGPVSGAAVWLAPIGPVIAVAEGIETALSYMQLTGVPSCAALSAHGIRSLILPQSVEEVIIATDPDPVGILAAQFAARGWIREGRKVSIDRPPLGFDFNDVARSS